MAWTNLPTDYTDATFTGLRKYIPIENNDGTTSFQDVTVYENKEKSFFGAGDANKMNEAINQLMGVADITPTMETGFGTLYAARWTAHGYYYTHPINWDKVQPKDRIDIQATADVLNHLMECGVGAMYVENNEGVLTVCSVGGVPTSNINIQITRLGVPTKEGEV